VHLFTRLATVLVAAGLVVAGGTAASADDTGAPYVGGAVVDDDDPATLEAYLAGLTDDERAEFLATQVPATTEVELGAQTPADGAAVSSLLTARFSGLAVTPMSVGCWTQRWTWNKKAAVGNTLFTYYHVGKWCASGSSVTSASIADRGGETSTPGWSYQGVTASASGIVSNEGRSYSKHKFVFKIGSFTVQTQTPCARVKGKYNATSTADGTCGIY